MIRQIDWELIWTLKQCSNITKTAELLYMTQPAVTKRLHQLEEEFRTPLVIRNVRGVQFTAKGEVIASFAEKAVREYNALMAEVREESADLRGELKIATCGSLSLSLLPSLLGDFQTLHPDVTYSLDSNYSYRVSQLVNTHAAQVGFLRGEYVNGCEKHLLGVNQAYAIYNEAFSLEDLPGIPRIEFSRDQLVSSYIDAWWYRKFKEPPRIGMTVSGGNTCFEMVRKGLGYAIFLSSDFIQENAGIYKLPLYREDGQPLIRNDWLVYQRDVLELDYVHSFIDYVKKYAADHFEQLNRYEGADVNNPHPPKAAL